MPFALDISKTWPHSM